MRTTRHEFTVYPPCWRPGGRYFKRKSVLQAKKLAYRLGVGTEVWRWTRTIGPKNGFLASSSSSDFEFEVI
jgi:hypothetical protein